MQNNTYWVVIPAAGIGSRFSNDIPKQYYKIHQKTILEHTLALFLSCPWVNKVVLALSPSDTLFSELAISKHPKITCVPGGTLRMHSVMNALDYLNTVAPKEAWVLVHDAVRPCLHSQDLLTLIQKLSEDLVGGILAAPVNDTIKFVTDKNVISHTVDRDVLWHALTPQMFRLELLIKGYTHCQQLDMALTDDASAIEQLGLKPKVVKAMFPNPKLTFERDLTILSSLLHKKEMSIV